MDSHPQVDISRRSLLARAIESPHPKYYDAVAGLSTVALVFDWGGMPLWLIAILGVVVTFCLVARRFALRVHPIIQGPRRSLGEATVRVLLATFAALVLAPLGCLMLVLGLGWLHGASAEEQAMASGLRAQVKAGVPRISMVQTLKATQGTVCLAFYQDKVSGRFGDTPWIQDALPGSHRSLFARDDYEVFWVLLRTPEGKVQRWELSDGGIPVVAPRTPTAGVPLEPEFGASRPCVALPSAVLLRVPYKGHLVYVLSDSTIFGTAP